MGLTDKIKQALGRDTPDKDGVTTPTGTGTGHHGTHTGSTGSGKQGATGRAEQAVESRLPGQHGTSQGTQGYSSGTGQQGAVGRTEQAVENRLPGHHGSSDTGTGNTSGYSTGNTGSGTHSYQVGDQREIDGRRGDMDSILSSTPHISGSGSGGTQNFSTSVDHAHWEEAKQKIELAEAEVATAQLHSEKANAALANAQQAENVMSKHATEHDRLLAEAERQRGLVSDPNRMRGGLTSAQGDLDAAKDAAARHNRALQDADAAFNAKQKELDGIAPRLQAEDQKVHGLATEYDNAMAKRDAVAADADRLRQQAAEAERARGGLSQTVESLMEKLRLAEEDMVARERAFLQARDHHRGLHEKLRAARGELDGVNARYQKSAGDANIALESAQGWDDKTAQLRNQLQEHEGEHNRLLSLIQRLKAELEAMLADLEGLRRHGQPNKQAIEDAEFNVNKHRKSLADAEARSKEAEGRYRQLVRDADAHKARAADAAKAAKAAVGDYEGNLKEAQLHGDRHAQLWSEAQQAGGIGSHNATSAFEKLKEKVETFKHNEA